VVQPSAAECRLGVIRDWDETSSSSRHVGYAAESGSEIRVLASATMGRCGVDAVARRVIQAPKLEPRMVRYELTDHEWAAIKPMLSLDRAQLCA
jgi:hypothetical protein